MLLVKHTGCGMLTFDNKTAKDLVRKNKGESAAKEVEHIDFLTFPNLEAKVKEDVEWLKSTAIEEGIRITGWVYEVSALDPDVMDCSAELCQVETGRARQVV